MSQDEFILRLLLARSHTACGSSHQQGRSPSTCTEVCDFVLKNIHFQQALPFLIHVPYIGLLPGVVALVLVDQVHQEEQVVGQVVLLLHVSFKPVRHLV